MQLALQSVQLCDVCQPCPLQNMHPAVGGKRSRTEQLNPLTGAVVDWWTCRGSAEQWEPSHAVAQPCTGPAAQCDHRHELTGSRRLLSTECMWLLANKSRALLMSLVQAEQSVAD